MLSRIGILREFPLRWALLWLILPHLAIVAMLPFGGPPMTWALVVTVPLVMLVAQLPWRWLKAAFAAALLLAVSALYVTIMFNLSPGDLSQMPLVLRDVRFLRSPEYFIGTAGIVAALYLLLRYAPKVDRFRTPMTWMLALLIGCGLIMAENRATRSTRGTYHLAPPAGALFTSATEQARITSPDGKRRNTVIIVVEALGVPQGGVERALFEGDWHRASWAARYDVSRGEIPYYGSTTNAEFRELCNVWADYGDYPFESSPCLPHRYRDAGYQTVGYHGFNASLFDRSSWYPKLGFDEALFARDLVERGAKRCGGMYEGACDGDISRQIALRLRSADKPQLIYWMTLNSHLPVFPDARMGTDHCDLGGPEWSEENPQLCRLFLVHHQLSESIDRLAMDPNLPPMDILIVGDHVPPFFDRASRLRFDPKNVPWIMLRARDGVQANGDIAGR